MVRMTSLPRRTAPLTSGGIPSPIEEIVGTIHGYVLGYVIRDDLTTETENGCAHSDGWR